MNADFQNNIDMILNLLKAQKNPNKYLENRLNSAINNNPMLKNILPLFKNNSSDLDNVMTSICKEYGINVNDSINYIRKNMK